jgi:hypothetical protein
MGTLKNIPVLPPRMVEALKIACLILVAGLVYLGTLDHSFHLDDKQNIWNNSTIQISELSVENLINAGLKGDIGTRPVANVTFALNYYWGGLNVRGYHAVNIIIHLMAGILIYYFVKSTLTLPLLKEKNPQAGYLAFFVALIWLVHPLQTQSVTYIVQRMNSMSSMFYMMAMLLYVRARITPGKTIKIVLLVLTLFAGLLAFGSKENTLTLPFFIILYEWYFFQDLRLKISRTQVLWLIGIGSLFIFILYLILGDLSPGRFINGYSGRPFTLAERLLTQPRVIVHYISLLLPPSGSPEPGL